MEEIFEEIMAKNYTRLMKDTNSSCIVYIENYTQAHQNPAAENPRHIENLKSSQSIKWALPSKEQQ